MDNPVTHWKKKIFRQANNTVCVKTKLGWRSIVGMQVMHWDGKRFLWGILHAVASDRVQIKIPNYQPGKDDKFINLPLYDGSWTFQRAESPGIPRTIAKPMEGPRCDRARTGIHPVTHAPILLQCVMRGAHSTCHFENPSNKVKKEVVIKNG